jgi:hypothetical protein
MHRDRRCPVAVRRHRPAVSPNTVRSLPGTPREHEQSHPAWADRKDEVAASICQRPTQSRAQHPQSLSSQSLGVLKPAGQRQAESGDRPGSPVRRRTAGGSEASRTAMPGLSDSAPLEQAFRLPAALPLSQFRTDRMGVGLCLLTGWGEHGLSSLLPSSAHPPSKLRLCPAQGEVVSIPEPNTVQPFQANQWSGCLPLGWQKKKPG